MWRDNAIYVCQFIEWLIHLFIMYKVDLTFFFIVFNWTNKKINMKQHKNNTNTNREAIKCENNNIWFDMNLWSTLNPIINLFLCLNKCFDFPMLSTSQEQVVLSKLNIHLFNTFFGCNCFNLIVIYSWRINIITTASIQ